MLPDPSVTAPARRGKSFRPPDIVLLPAIFLLTWVGLGLAGELLARWYFPAQQFDRCYVKTPTGGRYQPDCHSRIKMFESGWVDNDYNDCGYRSAHTCKTVPPDGLRVAVLGTSISRGYWVSYDQTFAGRIEHDLSVACGEPVDVQNVSQADSILVTPNGWVPIWHHIVDLVPNALKLDPKALVLVMSAFDLASYDAMPGTPRPVTAPGPASLRRRFLGLVKTVKDILANDSRAMLVARHIGYRNTDLFVRNDLAHGDSSAYLRRPFDARWSLRLKVADATIGKIAEQANAAGVPLIVVLMPERAQAALGSGTVDRYGADPFALGDALSTIVQAHHGDFIDMTQVIRTLPDPADLFFEINGHPNAAGHAALAGAIETALSKVAPAFASCRPARR